MILDKTINIKASNKVKKYYLDKGYEIIDDYFNINIKDLNPQSAYKVNVKCDVCGKEKILSYNKYIININNGGYYSCSSKCSIDKMKKTNLEKYGVKCSLQNNEIKDKRLNTWKIKYGVDNPNKSKIVRDKIEQTNLEKYGVKCNLSLESMKEIIKNSCINKYGVDNPNKSKTVRDKIEQTNLEKYGVKCPLQNDIIKQKTNKTNVLKYGFENPNKSEIVKQKKKVTREKNHLEQSKNFYKNLNINVIDIDFKNKEYIIFCDKCKQTYNIEFTLLKNRRYTNTTLCTNCHPLNSHSISGLELKLLEFIEDIYPGKIIKSSREVIKPYELDVYLPDVNLALEFNGIYWHNIENKDKDYHKIKSDLCNLKGINLLHIWEDDWLNHENIIKSIILKNIYDTRTNSKDVNIGLVEDVILKQFLHDNDINGFTKSDISLGLYERGELNSVLCVIKDDKDYNITRLTSKLNYEFDVRLFEHFISNYAYKSITFIANRNYPDIRLYEKLGFKLKHISEPILEKRGFNKIYNSGLLIYEY